MNTSTTIFSLCRQFAGFAARQRESLRQADHLFQILRQQVFSEGL